MVWVMQGRGSGKEILSPKGADASNKASTGSGRTPPCTLLCPSADGH